MFTDRDAAERFLEDMPLPGRFPAGVASAERLCQILRAVRRAGVEHVALDPAASGARKVLVLSVAHFLNLLSPPQARPSIRVDDLSAEARRLPGSESDRGRQ